MATGFWKGVRVVCYGALAVTVAGLSARILPLAFNLCRDGGAGKITCDGIVLRHVFDFGFDVIMFAAFTVLPVILALIGAVFLLRDSAAWFRS